MSSSIKYGLVFQVFVQIVFGKINLMSVLKVHDSNQFESYDEKREHVQAIYGQSITLTGWYNCSEEPEYLFNGKPWKQSKNTKIEFIGNNVLLKILKLEDKHTGFYEFFHPSLSTVGRLYLYVKSNNFFVPNESYELLCANTTCTVPCRLTNFADEQHVRLYLNGIEQSSYMSYDSRVGFKINRNHLRDDLNILNASCRLRYQSTNYTIELRDEPPPDWKLQLTITNPWAEILEIVLKSRFSCTTNCQPDSFKDKEILLRHEGNIECEIKSLKKEQITFNNDTFTMEKEFIIENYNPACSGKFISEIRNISSNKFFNLQSSAFLAQLELISQTDPDVEAIVGQKKKIAAVFRAPKQERQQRLDISYSLFSEELLCQKSSCIVYNETKTLSLITTINRTINVFRTVATDKPGKYRYSVKIHKSGRRSSIQELHWNVNVRAPIQLLSNCSSRLLRPTLCEFTCISTVPDDVNMYISRVKNIEDNPLEDVTGMCAKTIHYLTDATDFTQTMHTVRSISTDFHYLKTFVANITRTTSIRCLSHTEMSKVFGIDCVEFDYTVDSSFDNANSQDIYQGDSVTLKGGIAESNESFRILHNSVSSISSIITQKYSTLTLSNYASVSEQKFHLVNSTGYVLGTIILPASKKVITPFNSNILPVYYTTNTTLIICPILGSPIVYNWTRNGTLITGEFSRDLMLNSTNPLGNYVCCGINRAGFECAIINVIPHLKIISYWRSDLTVPVTSLIVLAAILLLICKIRIIKLMTEPKVRTLEYGDKETALIEGGVEETALIGDEEEIAFIESDEEETAHIEGGEEEIELIESDEEEIALIGTEEMHGAVTQNKDMTRAEHLIRRTNKNSTKVDGIIRDRLFMRIKHIAVMSEMQIFAYQRLFDHIAKSEEHTRSKKIEIGYFADWEPKSNDKIRRLMEIVLYAPDLDVMEVLLERSIVSFENDVISYRNHCLKIFSEVEEEKDRVGNLNRSNEESSYQQEKIQLENKVKETTSILLEQLREFRSGVLRKMYMLLF